MPTINYIPSRTTILNLTAKFQSANLKGLQAQETAPLELASLPNYDTHCKQPHTYLHTYIRMWYSVHVWAQYTHVHKQAIMKKHSTEITTFGGSILMCVIIIAQSIAYVRIASEQTLFLSEAPRMLPLAYRQMCQRLLGDQLMHWLWPPLQKYKQIGETGNWDANR